MLKKILSRTKYYSYIILPILTTLICSALQKKVDFFGLDNDKIVSLISVSATFVGALLTVLTIYLAVPKSQKKLEQLRDSYHEHIYLMNILAGLLIYILSMMIWIFGDNAIASSILFVAGLSNMVIAIYYTFSLIKYM